MVAPAVPGRAEVLLACGEMQRQCLDLKLDAQRSIAPASSAPHISYSKYADFLDEATGIKRHEARIRQPYGWIMDDSGGYMCMAPCYMVFYW